MLPLTLQTEAEAQRGFADLLSLVESRGGSGPALGKRPQLL